MKHLIVVSLLGLPTAALAQEGETGTSLMERGAKLFLEGLLSEMEPAIDEMQNLAEDIGPGMAEMMRQMGPAFGALMERVDDLSNYEPPVMLPNGDIIIRRKPEAPEIEGPIEL